MHIPPNEFITTKEAAKLSGYSSDYLARLARSNNIVGRQIGRAWLIDLASLEEYLTTQGLRKNARTQELARVRADEYRVRQTPPVEMLERFSPSILKRAFQPTSDLFASRTISLIVACAVVAGGALAAQTSNVESVALRVAALSSEVSMGLRGMLADVPTNIRTRITYMHDLRDISHARAVDTMGATTALATVSHIASAITYARTIRFAIADDDDVASRIMRAPSQNVSIPAPLVTVADIQDASTAFLQTAVSPRIIGTTLADLYRTLGQSGYRAIQQALSGYLALVDSAGIRALSLGADTRDVLAASPARLVRASIVLGTHIARAAHVVVAAEISAVYGLSAAGPATARLATAFVNALGQGAIRLAASASSGTIHLLTSQYLTLLHTTGLLA